MTDRIHFASAGAVPPKRERKIISSLDLAWQRINALGGVVNERDLGGMGYNRAIGDALDIIESLGGADPLKAADTRTDATKADDAAKTWTAEFA